MKLNLIMPMGGGGTRFGNRGYELPKPLIPIYGKPFFYWATRSIEKRVTLASLTFVVLREHIERFKIDKRILELFPKAQIVIIPEVLPGAVLTCRAGIEKIEEDEPILFNDCDHLFLCSEFYEFCKRESFDETDGALLTFHSDENKFSYVSYDENGYVNRTVEKEVISNDAICGAYYFKNKKIFNDAVQEYLTKCSYQEFFVSGVYNVMAEKNQKIIAFHTDEHVSFGTPEEYELAKDSKVYEQLI